MIKKNEDYDKEMSEGRASMNRFTFAMLIITVITTLPIILISIETFEDVLVSTLLILFYCFFCQLYLNEFFKISKKINTILYMSYLVILLFLIIGSLTVEQTDILWYAAISFVVMSLKAYLDFNEEKEEV